MNKPIDIPIKVIAADPASPAAAAGACGAPTEMASAARQAGKSETLDRYAADYPKGPHDAAEHVSCFWLTTRGSSDAPNGDHFVWLRMLRLWPDIHIAFLWCTSQCWLCAV